MWNMLFNLVVGVMAGCKLSDWMKPRTLSRMHRRYARQDIIEDTAFSRREIRDLEERLKIAVERDPKSLLGSTYECEIFRLVALKAAFGETEAQ